MSMLDWMNFNIGLLLLQHMNTSVIVLYTLGLFIYYLFEFMMCVCVQFHHGRADSDREGLCEGPERVYGCE